METLFRKSREKSEMMRQFYKPRYLSKEKLKKVVQEEAAPFGAALHYIVIVM